MKTKILADFQICISVPLTKTDCTLVLPILMTNQNTHHSLSLKACPKGLLDIAESKISRAKMGNREEELPPI